MINNYLNFILIIVTLSVAYDYYKTKDIFSISNIFNFFAFHYFFLGVHLYNFEYNNSNYKIVEEIARNIVFVLISFSIIYQLTPVKSVNYKRDRFNVNFLYIIFLLLILLDIYLIFDSKIVYGINRTENFQILYENKFIFLKEGLQNLIYIIIIYEFYVNKSKSRFKLHYLITLYMLIFSFVTISRFQIFLILFPHIYFLYKQKKVSLLSIILGYFISVFVFLLWKPILYLFITGSQYGTDLNYSELFNWLKNSITVMKYSNLYEYNSYLITLEGLINPLNDSSLAPTNWFMESFYYKSYEGGSRLGFSAIAEGFINGSLNYNILVFGFYGYMFKKLNFSKKPLYIILKLIVIILFFKLFRSESYNFFRNIAWYYFYPLLVFSLFNINSSAKKIR